MSVSPENYFVVSGWMVSKLGLRGNELMIFAIIYGFCQGDNNSGQCTASLQYFSDFINTSKVTIIKALKSLTDRELIIKSEEYRNSVKFTTYKINLPVVKKLNGGSKETLPGVVKNLNQGSKETLLGGSKETLPNNIYIDNINHNIFDINKDNTTMSKTAISPSQIVELFHLICISYPKVRSLSEERKKAIQARLRVYGVDTFKEVFQKAEASDFLRGKNSTNWSANFDWIIKDANFAKILDGNYDNRSNNNGTDSKTSENSSVWNGLDFSDLEIRFDG